jgi:hypothetical protein
VKSAGAAKISAGFRDRPGGNADGLQFVADVDHAHGLSEFLTLIGHRFPDHRDKILNSSVFLFGELGEWHAQQREGVVRANVLGKIDPRDHRITQVFVGRLLGAVQQFFAVHNFENAIPGIAVREIHAVALGSGGDGTVQALRRRTARARLLARQTEIADEPGVGRIA